MRIADWLRLARVSNLPTCVSNAMVGLAIGAGIDPIPFDALVGSIVAVSLLYVAGMILNDAVDVDVDRVERPERPIPAGRISLKAAYAVAAILIGIALIVLWRLSPQAMAVGLILVAAIVCYDLLHHIFAPAVLLMGAARSLVYLVAASAVSYPFNPVLGGLFAGALGVYVVLVTLIARGENTRRTNRSWMALVAPLVVLAVAGVLQPVNWMLTGAAAVVLLGWTGLAFARLRQTRTKQGVMAMLAGICLVDAFLLTLIDRPALMAASLACFVLTALAHRRIMGT